MNLALTKISNLIDELEKLYANQVEDLQQQIKDLKAKTVDSNKIKDDLKFTTEENELLILQLHQVQEKFEKYILETQDISKKLDATQLELDATQLELDATQLELEQFNQYYKDIHSKKKKGNRIFGNFFIPNFITKPKAISLKVSFIDNIDNAPAVSLITLGITPSWIEIDVSANNKIDVFTKLVYQNIPLCIQKKSLICFQYFDANDNLMKNVYGKAGYSEIFASNFVYLKPITSPGYGKLHSFSIPDGAAKLRIGLAAFSLYPDESILISNTLYIICQS